MTKTSIEFQEGSSNIFSDLALDNPEELQAKGMIGYHVIQILTEKNMKQKELSILLNIKQAEVSHLLNGHFSRFTTDKLLDFLKRLNQKVTIQISPHKQGEAFQSVSFGL